jgi:predicted Zn-dependent protease
LILCVLAGFTFQSCVRNPVTGKKEISFMSEEQEKALGAQSHPSIVATMGLYDDAKLTAFINEKGKAMAAISHRPDLPYQFYIVDSPVVNAFAVPGGYVYFTRGIMAHFNNSAEFAGVLGHEIGHITARHSARQQTSQILGMGGVILGSVLLDKTGQLTQAGMQGLQALMLSYSRAHETESDKIGVGYSSRIGYDAVQMGQFFGTLQRITQKAGKSIPEFQSTHPDPGNRLVNVQQLAKEYQAANPGTYAVERDSYLQMLNGLMYGDDPKQGFVENWVFYHPEIKFQFPVPQGWQHENSPIQFQMADKEGKQMMVLTLAEGKTLEEGAQSVVKQYNLKVLENRRTTINGIPALMMISQIQPQQQQGQAQTQPQAADPNKDVQLATWLYQHNGMILALHGASTVANFQTAFGTFQGVGQGFRPLNDPEKLNRKADRIYIKTVGRTTTFRDAMRGFGMPDARLEELAILNQLQLTDTVNAGMLLKTIGK